MLKPLKMFAVLLPVVCLFLHSPALPQSIWLNQKQVISLEVLKPDLDGPDNTTFITSTVFLAARLPLADELNFIGELPFAHGKIDFPGQESHDNLGNPYLGLELRQLNVPVFFEGGVRLPIANSSFASDFIGFFSDVDRMEAFAVDNLSLSAAVNLQSVDYQTLKYRARVGTSLLMETKGDVDPDNFIFFSGQLGYESEALEALAGITGRVRITEDRQLGQRAFLQLGFAFNYNLGTLRPGLHLKIPIEPDLRENLDQVFGLSLGIQK